MLASKEAVGQLNDFVMESVLFDILGFLGGGLVLLEDACLGSGIGIGNS